MGELVLRAESRLSEGWLGVMLCVLVSVMSGGSRCMKGHVGMGSGDSWRGDNSSGFFFFLDFSSSCFNQVCKSWSKKPSFLRPSISA